MRSQLEQASVDDDWGRNFCVLTNDEHTSRAAYTTWLDGL